MESSIVIQSKYVRKYLLLMAMEQIIDEYREKGFELKVQYPLSHNLRADLYAVKDDEKIVIEFVNGKRSEDNISRLKQITSEEGITLRVIDASTIKIEEGIYDTTK